LAAVLRNKPKARRILLDLPHVVWGAGDTSLRQKSPTGARRLWWFFRVSPGRRRRVPSTSGTQRSQP